MNNAIVVLLGALSLVACGQGSRSEPKSSAQTQSATEERARIPVATVEEVRTSLLERKPSHSEIINALLITNDNGVFTLRGRVDDEQTRNDIVNRVRSMPNVRGVRDELQVVPREEQQQQVQGPQMQPGGTSGTTTTTGATIEGPKPDHSDAIRNNMITARPKAETIIQSLLITDDGTIVTVSGTVPDEATHQALIKAARETSGVSRVQDDVKVKKSKTKTKKQ